MQPQPTKNTPQDEQTSYILYYSLKDPIRRCIDCPPEIRLEKKRRPSITSFETWESVRKLGYTRGTMKN